MNLLNQLSEEITYNIWGQMTAAKAGDKYLVGVWARANDALPIHDSLLLMRSFMFYVTDGINSNTPLGGSFFNPDNPNWQYMQTLVEVQADTAFLDVYLRYDNQRGAAFFDGLQVQLYSRAGEDSEEEDDDNDDDNPRDFSIATDEHSNLTGTRITDGAQSIYSFSRYTGSGNYLSKSIDALGNTAAYSYDENSGLLQSMTSGLHSDVTITDAEKPEAEFEPSEPDNLALTSAVNYSYNAMGALTKVQQTVTGLHGGSQLENSYDYSKDRLDSITHNGTEYSFEYNIWGQMTAAKAGDHNLVSYDFAPSGHRQLGKITYGNGDTITYQYDSDLQITGISLDNGSTWAYTYSYDSAGRLTQASDNITNTVTKFTLDGIEIWSGNALVYRLERGSESFFGDEIEQLDVGFETDDFGRLTEKTIADIVTEAYTYTDLDGDRTSYQIASFTNNLGIYEYSYDTKGNITKIMLDSTVIAEYYYDEAGQLIRENDIEFKYDKGGNIVEKDGVMFEYDSTWSDKLTKAGDDEIEYDEIGNPTKIGDDILTWNGRRLVGFNGNSYTYNESGLRTSKIVDGIKTEYFWLGDKLIGQKTENDVMYFNNVGFILNGDSYYYINNLQGDVTAIVDDAGNIVAEYEYDAWGTVLSSSGVLADVNPIRYRSYYYDSEIEMYYNQQRYYNPEWSRWLNADELFDGRHLVGQNLYAYCWNNPIAWVDYDGRSPSQAQAAQLADALFFIPYIAITFMMVLGRSQDYVAQLVGRVDSVRELASVARFESIIEKAKASGLKPTFSGNYGFLNITDEHVIISIKNQVMIVDWHKSTRNSLNRFMKLVTDLKEPDNSFWGWVAAGLTGVGMDLVSGNVGPNNNHIPIEALIHDMIMDMAFKDSNDLTSLAVDIQLSWMKITSELDSLFKGFREGFSKYVTWIDFKKIYGNDKNSIFGKKPSIKNFWNWF